MKLKIYFNNEIESVNVGDEVSTTTSTFSYDNETNDGSEPWCPVCGFKVNSEQQYSDSVVEEEDEVSESIVTELL